MPYENKYSTTRILRKVLACTPYDDSVTSAPFPYLMFKKIMKMREDVEPVISYERTLKQLYQDLIDFNLVSLGEDGSNRIYLDSVRTYLKEMGA